MILYSCDVKSSNKSPYQKEFYETISNTIDTIEIVNETIEVGQIEKYRGNSLENDGRKAWGIKYQKGYYLYDKNLSMGETNELDSIEVFLNYKDKENIFISKTTDKMIHASFSSDNKKLVINYLDERPEYYDASLDDYFWVYDLDSLVNGELVKDSIYCKYGSHGHIVGDKLYYTRSNERDDLLGGYWLTDIYVSPYGHIEDSVVVARQFGIRAVSSDGKYILAENKNVTHQYSCAIIDVEQRKYQVLLGRDYYDRKVFYSDEKKKFGFVFGNKIVYVDTPKTFPFDTMNKQNIFFRSDKCLNEKFFKPAL